MTKALVVIDVQNAMFEDPAVQPFEGEVAVERIAGLIVKARDIAAIINDTSSGSFAALAASVDVDFA